MIERDEDLLKRIAAGDQRAFDKFYQRHYARVGAWIRAISRSEDAVEEVRNEAFATVWAKAESYRGDGSALAWLSTITSNAAKNWFRKRRRQLPPDSKRDAEDVAESLEDPADRPDVIRENLERGSMVRGHIEYLPFKDQEILYLVYWEQRSRAEIGELLRIPEATVRTRLFNAHRRLRKRMAEAGDGDGG